MLRAALFGLALILLAIVILPIYAMLAKSVEDRAGNFVGLANYRAYFETPALFNSLGNSLFVALASTAIVIPLAFTYAYGLTRSMMPAKGLFKGVALIPILAPSLLPAISLVYLFGNQGVLKELLLGHRIYGALGIVISQVFYCFPHALMILVTALALADQRTYEVAETLGTSRWRIFRTITLPGAKYGLVSASFVVFTLVITDFGIAKVIGGQFNVLATDIYKQVIGQQNFQMGAVVGVVLILPALLSFVADRLVQRKQVALLTARAVPLRPKRQRRFDLLMLGFCSAVALLILGILGMAAYASLIKLWPYDLRFSLGSYDFAAFDSDGWSSYWHSLEMAAWTAVIGTALVFTGAYLVEKAKGWGLMRGLVHLMAMVPLAVPGLVLGLGYIFFFNAPANPLNFLYRTMAILVVCTIAHFYTVSHLTALTALKQLDNEFEAVSASLKVPFWRTFARVTVPVCLPAILDIAIYLFVNAMTTVSAVIFIYSTETKLASVAVVAMDDAGEEAAAAAMAMMIVYTSALVKLLQVALSRAIERRTQAWRVR